MLAHRSPSGLSSPALGQRSSPPSTISALAALEDEQTLRIQLPSEVLEPAPAQLLHAITPNPAGEWIAISGTLPNAGIARFRIFSTSGKLLLEWQQYLLEGPFALRYPLAGIAPGAYWLELLPPGHPPLQRPFTVVR
jgi:hypothetical protein